METVLFILFGAVAVCGAIMVVTRKHPMASALYLILTLFAVAALFVLRQAHFLAAVQVIVYAGAVVVLFAFVIMFLQQGALPAPSDRWLPIRVLAVVALAYFFYLAAPALADLGLGTRTLMVPGFGTTAGLGDALFSTYLVPFEAVSALLLAAIVGAVAIARADRRPAAKDAEPKAGGAD